MWKYRSPHDASRGLSGLNPLPRRYSQNASTRRAAFVLEESDGAGNEDEHQTKNDLLDKAALGSGSLGRIHVGEIRTNTPLASYYGEGGVLLGALFYLKGELIKKGLQV